MLASRLPGILPPLDPAETLEISMIHSVAGTIADGTLSRSRPFRDPHHTASSAAIIGGGQRARPGEVSLAHNGVLFLDELPEFQRPALEALRQPIETGKAVIARANGHVSYPARFQLVAAMNPCRCGWLDDPAQACSRAPPLRRRLSGAHLGPALRPHRHPHRRAGGRCRGSRPAPARGGLRRDRFAGRRRPRIAENPLRRGGHPHQRGGGR